MFENIKELFDNQKYQEITERLKEAKYWEKILTEIEERKDQIKNQWGLIWKFRQIFGFRDFEVLDFKIFKIK